MILSSLKGRGSLQTSQFGGVVTISINELSDREISLLLIVVDLSAGADSLGGVLGMDGGVSCVSEKEEGLDTDP